MKIAKRYLPSLTIFFLLLTSSGTQAQICSGSLGDPVVNVTFGSGTNPGSPLPGATTFYRFVRGDCPNDGDYTVTNSTSNCFSGSWHTVTSDHTPGDINGYMMLVNASIDTGDFYLDTISGLCAGTTYEFSAWIMNVLKSAGCSASPIVPNLVFHIETTTGQVLGAYSTGDIFGTSTPTWQQYGLFFTTPVNTTSVVIRLTNNAPGGCGNDLALDDITFRPCGPTVKAIITNSSKGILDLCQNNLAPVNLSATIGTGYILPTMRWQSSLDNGQTWTDITGATTTVVTVSVAAVGNYLYRLTAAESGNIGLSTCRVASNVVTVTVHELPVVTASSNSPVCENATLQLSAGGGATYTWSGPAGFRSALASPAFSPKMGAAGVYTVVVKDTYGCENTGSTTVVILPKPVISKSADAGFCVGGSAQLSAAGGISYSWSPATGLSDATIFNPVAAPLQTTAYTVTITNSNNCFDTATVNVKVYQKPLVEAGADKVLIRGNSVTLDGQVSGDSIYYFWSPATYLNDAGLMQPTSKPADSITYFLNATSVKGCGAAYDSVFVKVYSGIFIPTAFSPNNDGRNETWKIEALGAYPNAAVNIYNRYGNQVYSGKGAAAVWDGTYKGQPAEQAAYVYTIDLKNSSPVLKGTVLLLR